MDTVIQALNGVVLNLHVILKLLLDGSADVDLKVVTHVRSAIEIKDSFHQLLSVLHFVDGFLADVIGEFRVAPVLAHLSMKEVLIDGRELGLKNLLQNREDLGVTFHVALLTKENDFGFAKE